MSLHFRIHTIRHGILKLGHTVCHLSFLARHTWISLCKPFDVAGNMK